MQWLITNCLLPPQSFQTQGASEHLAPVALDHLRCSIAAPRSQRVQDLSSHVTHGIPSSTSALCSCSDEHRPASCKVWEPRSESLGSMLRRLANMQDTMQRFALCKDEAQRQEEAESSSLSSEIVLTAMAPKSRSRLWLRCTPPLNPPVHTFSEQRL